MFLCDILSKDLSRLGLHAFILFSIFIFLLEYNCFTVLFGCCYTSKYQPHVYIYPLPLGPPPFVLTSGKTGKRTELNMVLAHLETMNAF